MSVNNGLNLGVTPLPITLGGSGLPQDSYCKAYVTLATNSATVLGGYNVSSITFGGTLYIRANYTIPLVGSDGSSVLICADIFNVIFYSYSMGNTYCEVRLNGDGPIFSGANLMSITVFQN